MPNRILHKIRIILTRPDKVLRWMISRANFYGRKIAIVILPYSIGTKLLSWFCKQRWVQAIFFRPQIHRLRQCLKTVPTSLNEDELIRQSLTSNFGRWWRLAAITRCTPQQFDKWVTITGVATLRQAYQRGRGVILLNNKTAQGQILPLILVHLGFDDFLTVGNNSLALKLMHLEQLKKTSLLETNIPSTNKLLKIRQLHKGKQILEQGGIVHIVADAIGGDIRVPFHGYIRPFNTGFAELAISTHAEVIPVIIRMDIAGHIKVAFFEPLKTKHNKINHQEQVEFFIKQYTEFLEERWTEEIGNLVWDNIRRIIQLPIIT